MSFGRSMEAPMDFKYSDRPLKRTHNDYNNEMSFKSNDNVKFKDDDRRSTLIGSNTPFLFNRVDVDPNNLNNDNSVYNNFKWDVKASLGLGEVEMTDLSTSNEDSKLKVSNSAVNKMRKKRIRNQQSKENTKDEDHRLDYRYQHDIPKLLSTYAQMGFNLFLLLGLSLLAFKLVRTILKDVEHKVEVYVQSLNSESSACARSYTLNQCDPSTRVPVSEEACIHFEQCMHRDPTTVGIARVGAAAFAEILEGFANEIGLRGAMLIIVLLGFLWMMRNVGNRTGGRSVDQRMTIDENQIEEFQMLLRSQQRHTSGINNLKNRWGGGYKIESRDGLMDRTRYLR